jgi:hypothetical protein
MPVRKPIGINRRGGVAWLSATTAVHFGHRHSERWAASSWRWDSDTAPADLIEKANSHEESRHSCPVGPRRETPHLRSPVKWLHDDPGAAQSGVIWALSTKWRNRESLDPRKRLFSYHGSDPGSGCDRARRACSGKNYNDGHVLSLGRLYAGDESRGSSSADPGGSSVCRG